MLQAIVQCGTGAPTYIYSQNGANNSFFHVFAAQMDGYDSRRERSEQQPAVQKKFRMRESEEALQEFYQREFRVGGLQGWKQKKIVSTPQMWERI